MAQTVCGTCRSPQGPFERTVLKLKAHKVQHVLITCGVRRGTPKEERIARTKECLERRAELDKSGTLPHA